MPTIKKSLAEVELPASKDDSWSKAVVLSVSVDKAEIETADGDRGVIPLYVLSWARKNLKNQGIGNAPQQVSDVLAKGDVVLVEKNFSGNGCFQKSARKFL
ncbi:MAG: hypothetical protein ACLTT2_03805 [Alphaproteobacteria bacterium]